MVDVYSLTNIQVSKHVRTGGKGTRKKRVTHKRWKLTATGSKRNLDWEDKEKKTQIAVLYCISNPPSAWEAEAGRLWVLNLYTLYSKPCLEIKNTQRKQNNYL